MHISSEDLAVFRQLYLAQYGQDLSEAEALETARKMLRLVQLVYRPMTEADYEEITAHQTKIRASESYRSRQLVA